MCQILSLQQADGFAGVCEWVRCTGEKEYMWSPGHYSVVNKWWECNGEWKGIDPHPEFTNSSFWFLNMYKKLQDLYLDKECPAREIDLKIFWSKPNLAGACVTLISNLERVPDVLWVEYAYDKSIEIALDLAIYETIKCRKIHQCW